MRPEHLHRLAVLAEIADAGSISAAARRLGLVKSAISHHVTELEREIGVKVITRLRRGVALTAIGEVLAAHGRTIIKEADEALTAAKAAEAPRGSLRISMPAGIGDALLIPMLAAFLDKYPGMRINAIATDDILDIAAERIDVAFRIGVAGDGLFIARKLTEDRHVFVASPDYLARAGFIAIPADLAKHPLIGFAAFGQRPSFPLEAADGVRHEVEMDCRVTTTSALAIKHWAVAGAGIARMPYRTVRSEIESGALVHILPDYALPAFTLFAVYMPERFRPANVRRLIDHAAEYFTDDSSPLREVARG
jgi:molybdate transport repressor ModE-like protein